jgi:hypothetical protein
MKKPSRPVGVIGHYYQRDQLITTDESHALSRPKNSLRQLELGEEVSREER